LKPVERLCPTGRVPSGLGGPMLTPGNKKLGDKLIWSFGLPSGRPDVCLGLSAACRAHCYARRVEAIRPSVRARYAENLRLSRLPDFEQRLYYDIVLNRVAVVRVHSGGDFYSATYARKWLRVLRRLPRVRFFLYTRCWRDDAVRPVLERMARRRNCRVWYSCDRETGLPARVPPRVRLAWLMTEADDSPPDGVHLVFRVRRLRRQAATRLGGVRVCPEEDGVRRRRPVTCDRCGLCWRALPQERAGQVALPMLSS
jgi:Gene product 88